ncbi:MAG TPA: PEP-CTERM sorting domain-containing protein [Bryobacteraceae bacterium]|jgi:hypothetical protein|nr:PEP-CTERM sorting domain-containing protein [Bryobacteraceae bacterium]
MKREVPPWQGLIDLGITISRLAGVGVFVLLCGGGARADIISGAHFSIDLGNVTCPDQTVATCGNSVGGWVANQGFTAMANQVFNPADFQNNVFCDQTNPESPCFPDPIIRINLDGHSTDVVSPFSFQANANGGGFITFHNTDDTFHNLLITTDLVDDKFYQCGGAAYADCGFRKDPNNSQVLDIAFFDPVPEPASVFLLLPATGLIAAGRKARRNARRGCDYL